VRVVLDTNVLISGIFFGGPPGRILDSWAEGKVALAVRPFQEDPRILRGVSQLAAQPTKQIEDEQAVVSCWSSGKEAGLTEQGNTALPQPQYGSLEPSPHGYSWGFRGEYRYHTWCRHRPE
jgi:hypothetical protein